MTHWLLVLLILAPHLRAQTVTGTHHLAVPHGTGVGETGELRSYELTANGEDFFGLKAPDAMAAPTVYTVPNAFTGTNGFVLASTTGGVLSWVAQAAGGVAGGSLSGTYPNPALAATQPDAHTWNGLPKFTANLIIGSSGMVVPATAADNLVLEGGVAPTADPATTGVAHWADPTLGAAYRTGVTNEGDGLTHALHNRFVEQYGTGTAYQFTAASAAINFGTNDPQVTIPSAGTWMLKFHLLLFLNGATFPANRTVKVVWRRTNNTPADLLSSDAVACRMDFQIPIVTTITQGLTNMSGTCIYTTTNSNDIIAMVGNVNTVPTAGSLDVVSAGAYLQAIRLF